jgi:hypothetical protein
VMRWLRIITTTSAMALPVCMHVPSLLRGYWVAAMRKDGPEYGEPPAAPAFATEARHPGDIVRDQDVRSVPVQIIASAQRWRTMWMCTSNSPTICGGLGQARNARASAVGPQGAPATKQGQRGANDAKSRVRTRGLAPCDRGLYRPHVWERRRFSGYAPS